MGISNVVGLMGGLALFIFGMDAMSTGLKNLAGPYLKRILERLTANRLIALLLGTALTAVIQSSNAMCVMVIGFINANIMTLENSIGVMMGAKIGTTITGQLIAFNITEIAPVIAFVGVGMMLFMKKKRLRDLGSVIAALGILFIGMGMMSDSMKVLQGVQWFRDLLMNLSNPILGVIVGVVFTVIVQSVSASVGVLQVMAAQSLIGFETAFFVMMGMNIGACIAPAIASLGGTRDTKRAAFIVFLFETVGVVIFLALSSFLPVTRWLQGTSVEPLRQVANANSIFNLVTVLLLLPFAPWLARVSRFVIRGEDQGDVPRFLYINEASFENVALIASQVDREAGRMEEAVDKNLELALGALSSGRAVDMDLVAATEEVVDFLNRGITDALVKMMSLSPPDTEARQAGALFHVVNDLERIGDHAENIAGYATKLVEHRDSFSGTAREELARLMAMVRDIYADACRQRKEPTQEGYDRIYYSEEAIDDFVAEIRQNHVDRLAQHACNAEQGVIFVEALTDIERIADHSLNIAQRAGRRFHHTVREDSAAR